MEVRKVEDVDSKILRIEFIGGGDEDFKVEIKAWLKKNYPNMTFTQVFDKLVEFRLAYCCISMA